MIEMLSFDLLVVAIAESVWAMGNCVLVQRDQKSGSKLKWSLGSKTVVHVNEPIEPSAGVWEKEIGRLGSSPLSLSINHVATSPEPSKGDEMFFDSQAWLDSDNEDFFSVNGDNTPLYRSTPIRHLDSVETSTPKPSPIIIKKQLFELFRESFDREHGTTIANSSSNNHIELVRTKANNNEPILSVRSKSIKGKSAQSTPCCIPVPKLARSLSLGDKKKRMSSPCRGSR